jgi:hypothetical protein
MEWVRMRLRMVDQRKFPHLKNETMSRWDIALPRVLVTWRGRICVTKASSSPA